MIDLPSISAIIVAVSVVIGLVFTMMELRHMAQTRRTEVITRIYERFSTGEMVDALNTIGRSKLEGGLQKSPPAPEVLTAFAKVATVLEGLGVLLEQKLIDVKLVNSLFGPTLDYLWEPMEPLIVGMRKSLNQPFFFSHFETLHNTLKEYRLAKSQTG